MTCQTLGRTEGDLWAQWLQQPLRGFLESGGQTTAASLPSDGMTCKWLRSKCWQWHATCPSTTGKSDIQIDWEFEEMRTMLPEFWVGPKETEGGPGKERRTRQGRKVTDKCTWVQHFGTYISSAAPSWSPSSQVDGLMNVIDGRCTREYAHVYLTSR